MGNVIQNWAPLLARIFIGGMFLMTGVQKFMGLEGVAGYIASVGLPLPMMLAVLVAILEVVAGLSLILGYKIFWGASALFVFTLLVSFIFHSNFADPMQMALFTKNIALSGGLLYMMAFGAGRFSLGNRRSSAGVTVE